MTRRVHDDDPISVVYWLYDDHCSCPEQNGYVGACTNIAFRIACHRRSFGNHKGAPGVPHGDFKVKILFTGTLIECDTMERELRPYSNIGWNRYRGGRKSLNQAPHAIAIRTQFGAKPKSAEHREKISKTLRGDKPRKQHTKYGSPEYYKKLQQRRTRKGIPHSPETIEKIRQATQKTPEQKIAASKAGKARWRNPKYRKRMIAAMNSH